MAAHPVLPAKRANTGVPEVVEAVEPPRADRPPRRPADSGREAPGVSEAVRPRSVRPNSQSVWSSQPADAARVDPFLPAPVSLAALILLAAGLVFLLAWLAIG